MQHTPTPWHVETGVTWHGAVIENKCSGAKGLAVIAIPQGATQKQSEANAAFIVRACNSHDALVMVARLVADTYEAEQTRGGFPAGQTWHTIDHTTGQAARAALALAKEA